MQPTMSYTGQLPVDPLILSISPMADGQISRYTLYEDSGHAEDYQRNLDTAWTDITARQQGDDLTVTVGPVRGGYPGMPSKRGYELQLPGDWPPASVSANGVSLAFTRDSKQLGWRLDGNTLTTIVPVAPADVHQTTTMVIHRAPGSMSSRDILDGFAGRTERLREAYDAFAADYPAMTGVPDEVTIAMQTGNRISYHPETARDEMSAFAYRYATAMRATENVGYDVKKPKAQSVTVEEARIEAERVAEEDTMADDTDKGLNDCKSINLNGELVCYRPKHLGETRLDELETLLHNVWGDLGHFPGILIDSSGPCLGLDVIRGQYLLPGLRLLRLVSATMKVHPDKLTTAHSLEG